jgi:hypothetical protein
VPVEPHAEDEDAKERRRDPNGKELARTLCGRWVSVFVAPVDACAECQAEWFRRKGTIMVPLSRKIGRDDEEH